ncbi:MAG: hypothetical protein KAY54_06330 [Burkholderiaceae bacterium]|nr:hypothetical protein [Burkholderiaceae bacterium]
MATAENAKLQYEAGQNSVAMSALTNSGDETTFTSAATLWSGRSGYAPVVRPNGVLTGFAITTHASDNTVTIAAGTLNLAGVVTSVNAGTLVASRPATAVSKVISLTVNSSGALAAVAGTDGSTTAFSETRAAAGGPPLIPVGSVEIGQVRYTSNTAGVVAAAEIYQVVGLHRERADFPLYDINYDAGSVTFLDALPEIHTGPVPKAVYASYSSPIFADVALASDFVPPETSHSVSSTQVYGTTLGATSSTLGQGAFTAYLANGVADALVTLKNETLWFKFFPDRYATPYILAQGKLGIARTFPAGDSIQAACTISAASAAVEVS